MTDFYERAIAADQRAKEKLGVLIDVVRETPALSVRLVLRPSPLVPSHEVTRLLTVATLATNDLRPARRCLRLLLDDRRRPWWIRPERWILWLAVWALALAADGRLRSLDRDPFGVSTRRGGHDGGRDVRLDAWAEHAREQFFEFAEKVGRSIEEANKAVLELQSERVHELAYAAAAATLAGLRPRAQDGPARRVRGSLPKWWHDVVAAAEAAAALERRVEEAVDAQLPEVRELRARLTAELAPKLASEIVERLGGMQGVEARVTLRTLALAWRQELRLQAMVREAWAEGWSEDDL